MIAAERGHDYCPHQVERWLCEWDLLVSLAESPKTSSHHLRPGHNSQAEAGRPCLPSPRAPGGAVVDPLSWADILADLAGGVERLPVGSLERRVAFSRIAEAGTLGQVATILRTRKGVVLEAFHAAAAMVAVALGYDPTWPCACKA